MLQVCSFRNKSNNFGIFQKNDNIVSYWVETDNPLYSPSGSNSWSTWVESVQSGCIDEITKESIEFFLNRYAESINVDIVEIAHIKNPGSFYPRISRGNIGFNYLNNDFLQDVRAFGNIQSGLDEIFNYIEPVYDNLECYGHKIRELLILACTEVECLLVNALIENGYKHQRSYTTKDFIILNEVFKLNDYEVSLAKHPDLKLFKPFLCWNKDKTTASIPWYEAYNAVKHNRSTNIKDANLRHLLDAVAAIHILLEAQYGKSVFNKFLSRTDDKSIFITKKAPQWKCSEVCAPILIDGWSIKTQWNDGRKFFEDNPLPE